MKLVLDPIVITPEPDLLPEVKPRPKQRARGQAPPSGGPPGKKKTAPADQMDTHTSAFFLVLSFTSDRIPCETAEAKERCLLTVSWAQGEGHWFLTPVVPTKVLFPSGGTLTRETLGRLLRDLRSTACLPEVVTGEVPIPGSESFSLDNENLHGGFRVTLPKDEGSVPVIGVLTQFGDPGIRDLTLVDCFLVDEDGTPGGSLDTFVAEKGLLEIDLWNLWRELGMRGLRDKVKKALKLAGIRRKDAAVPLYTLFKKGTHDVEGHE